MITQIEDISKIVLVLKKDSRKNVFYWLFSLNGVFWSPVCLLTSARTKMHILLNIKTHAVI